MLVEGLAGAGDMLDTLRVLAPSDEFPGWFGICTAWLFTFTNIFNGTAPVGIGGPAGTGGPTGVGPPTGDGTGPRALLFMYSICGTGAPFIPEELATVVEALELGTSTGAGAGAGGASCGTCSLITCTFSSLSRA